MKKNCTLKLITLLFALAGASDTFAQTFTKIEGLPFRAGYGSDLEWGDYDKDGDMDVLISGFDGTVEFTELYRNDGNNLFIKVGNFLQGTSDVVSTFGDIDNDGDLDIFIARSSGNPCLFYRNDGNDSFVSINPLFGSFESVSVAFGDLDNDGDVDLIFQGYDTNNGNIQTEIYSNNGIGVFTEVPNPIFDVYGGGIDLGDYDSDGDLDIAINGNTSPNSDECITSIYRNDGNFIFVDLNLGLQGVTSSTIKWGDADNDGDLDFMFTGVQSSDIHFKIYRNDGNDIFTEMVNSIAGVDISAIAWADVDNDNDLDIIFQGLLRPEVYGTFVFKNNNFVFSEDQLFSSISSVGKIAVNNYDKDGDVDILVIGSSDSGALCELYQNNLDPVICFTNNTIAVQDANPILNTDFTTSVNTSEIKAECNTISYEFTVNYDPAKVSYTGYTEAGTLSEGHMVLVNSDTPGSLTVMGISMGAPFSGTGSLVDLQFKAISCENSTIGISNFSFNGEANTNLTAGTVDVKFAGTITVNNADANVGCNFYSAVSTADLSSACGLTAYAFEMSYDPTMVSYMGYSLSGTLDPTATVSINSDTPGVLAITATSAAALNGLGELIKIEFKPLMRGTAVLEIQNFFFNTDPITDLTNGSVTVRLLGDINNDGKIISYDAAILMQYVVGNNTAAYGVALPWDAWRIQLADVNGDQNITSDDVLLIAKYAAKIISSFPKCSSKKSAQDVASISVVREGNYLVFYSDSELGSFDMLSVEGNKQLLGQPEAMLPEAMMATNTRESNYRISWITLSPKSGSHAFLRIPVSGYIDEMTFNVIGNSKTQSITVKKSTTAVNEINADNQFSVYPVPASDMLTFEFFAENASDVKLTIRDLSGKTIATVLGNTISEGKNNIDWNCKGIESGIYFVEFTAGIQRICRKIVITK